MLIETSIPEIAKSSINRQTSSPTEMDPAFHAEGEHKSSKSPLINLEDFYEYLNKNVENLKMNLELKSFGFKNDSLYIKKSLMREYQKKVEICKNSEYQNQNAETNLEEITSKTVIDTLQDLIDNGKIQHAFLIFSTFRNRIKVPDKILRRWSHGYLELLRTHKLYKLANRCVKDSPIKEIKDNNKTAAIIYTKCGKCKKNIENLCGHLCPTCKASVKCSICQKPIRGLMIWCQVCSHSGHIKEIAAWFKLNKECPVGCGHKCFDYYKQINLF